MTIGELGVPAVRFDLTTEDEEALQAAKAMLANKQGVAPDEITAEAIAEAYQTGGFSEWPPEQARRVVRALSAAAGLKHV